MEGVQHDTLSLTEPGMTPSMQRSFSRISSMLPAMVDDWTLNNARGADPSLSSDYYPPIVGRYGS